MADTQSSRISHVAGAGTFALKLLPSLLDECAALGATQTIAAAGVAEFNLSTLRERPPDFARDGIVDISIKPKDIQDAIGNSSSPLVSAQNDAHQSPQTQSMIDRLIAQKLVARVRDGQLLWLEAVLSGHTLQADRALGYLQERSPATYVTAWSVIPHDHYKRIEAPGGYERYHRLQERGVVLATVLTDNSSPLTHRPGFTLGVQDRYCTRTFAALIGAQRHFAGNPSMSEVVRALAGGDSAAKNPFIGMSFASATIAPVGERGAWTLLRRVPGLTFLPTRGIGDDGNIFQVAMAATKEAIEDPAARAIEDPIDLRRTCFAVYFVPIRLDEPRRWARFSTAVRTWLANTYPTITPIFVASQGVADPRFHGAYWLQVSLLYPVSPFPAGLSRIAADNEGRRAALENGRAGVHDRRELQRELQGQH